MKKSRLNFSWLPASLYMGLIWVLSSLSWVQVPSESVPWQDKGLHALEYFGLGFLVAYSVLRTWPGVPAWRTWLSAVVICMAWGILDEVHQAFVPQRVPEAADLVADMLGVAIGALVLISSAWLVRAMRRAHR